MKIGTPLSSNATKVLFLGGGELGKEVVLELQRLGVETIVCDRYQNSPAMQIAHRSHVIDMLAADEIVTVCTEEEPDLIVPEIEAINTDILFELEQKLPCTVIPNPKTVQFTMNRKNIRQFASQLGLKTSNYRFANDLTELKVAAQEVGFPCVIKPIMSSSGKGQAIAHNEDELESAWQYSQQGGRVSQCEVIIEEFIDFDYEITLLTVNHVAGISFCEPIAHTQIKGDYRYSWQPGMPNSVHREKAQQIATQLIQGFCKHGNTNLSKGYGIYGVEMFIKGDEIYFSEVSPRPHDTGLVTLTTQMFSEFALHTRAILGLPISKNIALSHRGFSLAIVLNEGTGIPEFDISELLQEANVDIRLFGKPEIKGSRRMGVILKRIDDHRQWADFISSIKTKNNLHKQLNNLLNKVKVTGCSMNLLPTEIN